MELAVRQSGTLKTESIEVGKEVWFWERTCEEERRLQEKTGWGGGGGWGSAGGKGKQVYAVERRKREEEWERKRRYGNTEESNASMRNPES